jgi:hypothetical protein
VTYSWKLAPAHVTSRRTSNQSRPALAYLPRGWEGERERVKGILPRSRSISFAINHPGWPVANRDASLAVLSFNPNSLLIVSRKARSRDAEAYSASLDLRISRCALGGEIATRFAPL